MAKKSTTALPPCMRVKIGEKQNRLPSEGGCTTVGSKGIEVGNFDVRPGVKFTSQNVRGGRGEKCGTYVVKSGKDKGKTKKKACVKPCGLIKASKGKQRCPIQLAYTEGKPFLRLCTAKGKQGYRINVNSPADALEKATNICEDWQKAGKKFKLPAGTALAGKGDH